MLKGLFILLLFQLAGEVIVTLTSLPVPGPVVGMVLLFTGLLVRGSLDDDLRKSAQGLLKLLSLLFIPAGSGIVAYGALLREEWLPIAVAVFAGTLLTMAVTALVMHWVVRTQKRGRHA